MREGGGPICAVRLVRPAVVAVEAIEGVKTAPHRSNRSKPPTQDWQRLSRYMRRWLVERFFAWIQWQRRILVRWEYYAQNFLGFGVLQKTQRKEGNSKWCRNAA
jgi:hypothetical protein